MGGNPTAVDLIYAIAVGLCWYIFVMGLLIYAAPPDDDKPRLETL